MFINKREQICQKYFRDSKTLIECWNNLSDVHLNIDECNPWKKCKNIDCILWYDCRYARLLKTTLITSFIYCRKLFIWLFFITQSCSAVPKNSVIKLSNIWFTKIPNKCQLQQVAVIHSSGIGFDGFIKSNKNLQQNLIFLVKDTAHPSDHLLHFQKNLIQQLWIIMTIDEEIVAGKKEKYKLFTGEKRFPPD